MRALEGDIEKSMLGLSVEDQNTLINEVRTTDLLYIRSDFSPLTAD